MSRNYPVDIFTCGYLGGGETVRPGLLARRILGGRLPFLSVPDEQSGENAFSHLQSSIGSVHLSDLRAPRTKFISNIIGCDLDRTRKTGVYLGLYGVLGA